MAQNNPDIDEKSELDQLAIEGKLPLKAVGIENLKRGQPTTYAASPVSPSLVRTATNSCLRLAVPASVPPLGVDADDLLRWMKIGPSQGTDGESIVEYVARKKSTEDERDGTLQDHYDYPRPFTQSPSENDRNEIHQLLRNQWDGELPTVLPSQQPVAV